MKRNTGNGCGSRNKTNKPFGEERAEMDLKWISQMAERVHELEEENKCLKGLLEECENKREPDMTKPQPCTKYRDAERMAWIAKLVEVNPGIHFCVRCARELKRKFANIPL